VDGRPIEASERPSGHGDGPRPGTRLPPAPPRPASYRDRLRSPYEALPLRVRLHAALTERWVDRGPKAAAVALVAVAAALLLRAGVAGGSARGRDEGALVAGAWALGRSLPEAARTVAPGRPSFAVWQLSAWDRLTGAFDRAPSAVAGGREAMAVALAASAVLTWVLGRRLGLSRWAAAPGLAVVALSPLAADLHRTVQPGALAAPWLLAALALARTRRPSPAAWASGGAALALAVLTSPVAAAAAPAVTWQMWRTPRPSARRRALLAFLAGAAGAGALGWLVVLGRGSPFVAGAGLGGLGGWLARSFGDVVASDPVTASVVAVAAVLAPLAVRRFRPLAAAFWPLVLVAAVSTAPAVATLAVALPLGAVLLGGALEALWEWTQDVRRARRQTSYRASRGVTIVDGLAPALLTVVAVAAAVSGPRWVNTHAEALDADHDRGVRAAVAWLDANTPDTTRLVVDETTWLDVVLDGTDPADIAVPGRLTGSTLDYHYAVVAAGTPDGGSDDDGAGALGTGALARGLAPAAVFGHGADQVEIRRLVDPDGSDDPLAVDIVMAGSALADNPRLDLAPEADAALRGGWVDERVLTLLATVVVDHRVAVDGFPIAAAEARAAAPARTVVVAAIDDRPVPGDDPAVADVMSFLEHQVEAWYQPARIEIAAGAGGRPVLRITFPPM
jgi:hypothetical protein